jgi:trimeric autotransporter adhesin
MINKMMLAILCLLVVIITNAQNIGIGTTSPNSSAMLDITASNKGLLIPRTSTATRTAIINPAKGLMVYDTTTNSFWYHNGTTWTQIDGSNAWSLTGNNGIDSVINFVGTTDSKPLIFRVNNKMSGYIGYNTSNTGFGFQGLGSNTAGNYNTANGTYALFANTLGNNNTAIGSYTLLNNTTGGYNLAIGSDALHNNTSGYYNVANGAAALYSDTSGSNNTAIGNNALRNNLTGYSNVAIGISALYSSATLSNQVAIGDSALFNNGTNAVLPVDGYQNTAVGTKALYNNTTGPANTAVGGLSMQNNTIGFFNTAIGDGALISNTTGGNNVAVGLNALSSNLTGNDNIAIGRNADVANTVDNAIAIGYYATVGTSNTIQLGNESVTSVNTYGNLTANGYVCRPGINSGTRGNVFNIDFTPGGAAQLWIDVTNLGTISVTSDRRLKENIDLMKGSGIERMMQLKPVHFMYKKIEGTIFSGSNREQEGFIADELQQVIPSAVNGEKNALTSKGTIQPQTINIVPVVAVLTKAVQEQQAMIETQDKAIVDLNNKLQLQQQQISTLLSDMEKLKQK